jgi:hypothetical protein
MSVFKRQLMTRGLVVAIGLVMVAAFLSLTGDRSGSGVSTTADVTQFNAGNIISDGVFFNAGAMSASDIAAFISAKGLACKAASDGTPCLKSFSENTATKAADSYCSGYPGANGESAAVIIAKVSSACGINPQVLLVILQKEQGLVKGSGSSLVRSRGPSSIYDYALGYGCPDTGPCNPAYAGFHNQIYSAARQFRVYAANPAGYGYRAGRTTNIQWSPNASCGSSPVYVQNQATAGLYIYTPYQPNGAALAAGYGNGDGCSAYGNRNFWLYFTDWFGSTQGSGQSAWDPVGTLDQLTATGPTVAISGWAADPDDLNGVTTVHVYVDGVGQAILSADQPRADLSGYHGYVTKLPMTVGQHTVCTYAMNTGRGANNTNLACQKVTVSAANGDNPLGVESAGASGRTMTVSGWALDPNSPSVPLTVHVYVDGVGLAILSANQPGAPTGSYIAGSGGLHNYTATLSLPSGRHNVCTYGINTGAGTDNTMLGCTSVYLDPAAYNPVGSWDPTTITANVLHVSGWARDDDATSAVQVPVYVNGVGVAILAAGGANATSDGHGFSADIPLSAGSNTVCVYAVNVGDGTTNPVLGCRTTNVAASVFNPQGALESVSAVGAAVTVSGWVTDVDAPTSPVTVHVYSDGVPQMAVLANGANPAADGHGYTATVSLPAGVHNVCTYAINTGQGTTNPQLGCKSMTVQPNPIGSLTDVGVVGGTATLSGWAADPDLPGQALTVHVYLDGVPQFAVAANGSDATADGHGYRATLTSLTQGRHNICTYAINVGPGTVNTQLGCRTVSVTHNPGGELSSVMAIGGAVSLAGRAVDPDVPAQALIVHVYVDGVPQFAVAANGPDAVADGHGYTASLTLPLGTHSICTYAINVGAGDSNTQLGCQSVTLSSNPSGALDPVTVAGSTANVSGWATDPDVPDQALTVHVYLDGVPQFALLADGTNAVSAGHGYAGTLAVPRGTHSVCTYAINAGAGNSNTQLGCKTVTVG